MISKNAIKRGLKKSKKSGPRWFRKQYSRMLQDRKSAFERLRGIKQGREKLWRRRMLQRRKALAEKKIAHKMLQSVSRQKELPKDIHRNIAQFL